MNRTHTRIPTIDQICFWLNVLLMWTNFHMQKKAVSGRVIAFVTIEIEGSMAVRPKTNRMFPVKSAKAG